MELTAEMLTAEMLGHTSSEITNQHYHRARREENPITAEVLETLAPRQRSEGLS